MFTTGTAAAFNHGKQQVYLFIALNVINVSVCLYFCVCVILYERGFHGSRGRLIVGSGMEAVQRLWGK